MGHHRTDQEAAASRRTTWGAPSLLGQALAAARGDGPSGSDAGGGPSRRVISHRRRSRSRSRSREYHSSRISRRVQREGAGAWGARGGPAAGLPNAAARRHVRTWLAEPRTASALRGPRDYIEGSLRAPLSRRNGEGKEELWSHDMFEGGEQEAASSVFVRGLPTDITRQELTANFSKCGKVVSVRVDARGRTGTAEVSFAQKGAAEIAAKTFHGVYVHLKRGREKFCLKVAVVDKAQQPEAVEEIEEDEIPRK
ncbi:uncharacterized protein LOC34619070 [Cyclospora cayetanensis]|uniref:Uncharacterized protein LOC34619070 n=1 Tax=Cyclospora cayetanensis TaxID=88456 RepID=A0A6P6RYM1_9EIME|nr:uncharacterized protein LOC34619070 [Cyclospora cayetanensis]